MTIMYHFLLKRRWFAIPRSAKLVGYGNKENFSSTLTVCQRPVKVKQMRYFIGVVRAFSRCFPEYSEYLSKLEDAVAGKESAEIIDCSDDLITTFSQVQNTLRNPKVLTLPHPNDQLILISDGCNSPPSMGSTLYVKLCDKLLVAGFFQCKAQKISRTMATV